MLAERRYRDHVSFLDIIAIDSYKVMFATQLQPSAIDYYQ
jgi:hypothetical protein